jgi:hypothetical protein
MILLQLFYCRVVDTGKKLSPVPFLMVKSLTSVVVNTSDEHKVSNISANFRKHLKWPDKISLQASFKQSLNSISKK